jgi:chemotaxis protein methyltransferase CheR
MESTQNPLNLSETECSQICSWVLKKTGIVLDSSKKYLVENRLRPLIRTHNAGSYLGLLNLAREGNSLVEREMIDSISTNETFFNRDQKPFNLLIHKLIPDLVEMHRGDPISKLNPIRIWSAACSTGQEVYSIAIALKKVLLSFDEYPVQILGTDISDGAVSQASRGIYNGFEAKRGLASEDLNRYFTSQGHDYQVSDEIRSVATFKQFNLLGSALPGRNFPIVFCRNVAIYFSENDKVALFSRIHQCISTNGHLIIGSTETLPAGCQDLFSRIEYQGAVYYEKR